MTVKQGDYLNVKDLADYLRVSATYIYHHWPRLVTEGKIRTYRIGKKILFNRNDIDKAMEKKFLA